MTKLALYEFKKSNTKFIFAFVLAATLCASLFIWNYVYLRRFDVIFDQFASQERRTTAYYKFICTYFEVKCRPQNDYSIQLLLDEDPAYNAARFDMMIKQEFLAEKDTFKGQGCYTIGEDNLLCDLIAGSIPVKYGARQRLRN